MITHTTKQDPAQKQRLKSGFPTDAGFWMRWTFLVALAAMLTFRRKHGERTVAVFRMIGFTVLFLAWVLAASAVGSLGNQQVFEDQLAAGVAAALGWLVIGLAKRFIRWLMWQQGEQLSSMSLGISLFVPGLPNGNAERYIDPLLAVGVGVFLCSPYTPISAMAAGSWLVLSGFALLLVEKFIHERFRDQEDALMAAGEHDERTGRFMRSLGIHSGVEQRSATEVPTGLDRHLAAKVAQNRAKAAASLAALGVAPPAPMLATAMGSLPEPPPAEIARGIPEAPGGAMSGQAGPAQGPAMPPSAANQVPRSISEVPLTPAWQERFLLIQKAGGPTLPRYSELTAGERMNVGFNLLALLFGPIYYLAKGMWKPALALFAAGMAVTTALELLLPVQPPWDLVINVGMAALFAGRANVDFYKKTMLQDEGWLYPGVPVWIVAAVIAVGISLAQVVDTSEMRAAFSGLKLPSFGHKVAAAAGEVSADGVEELTKGASIFQGTNGYKKDEEAAAKLFLKSAAKGNALAEYFLSRFYESGQAGLPQDPVESLKWLRRSAEHGWAHAQLKLGSKYEEGTDGIAKSNSVAIDWYRKAAAQNLPEAQLYLGDVYKWGKGVNKDIKLAEAWYRKASDQGLAAAKYNLGRLYFDNYPPKSQKFNQGGALIIEAAELGEERAKKEIENLPK